MYRKISFVRDQPKTKIAPAKHILKLCQKVANFGSCDALNDVASSHATGYADLPFDFKAAVRFYVCAIQAGSIDAISKLGINCETAMCGKVAARTDIPNALYIYKAGVRCQTCTRSLASWYERGIEGILPTSIRRAENLFRRLQCDDANDAVTACRTLKDLTVRHIAELKIADRGTEEANFHGERPDSFMSDRKAVQKSLADVEKATRRDVQTVKKKDLCTDVFGQANSTRVAERAGAMLAAERKPIATAHGHCWMESTGNKPDEAFVQVFGFVSDGTQHRKRSQHSRKRY